MLQKNAAGQGSVAGAIGGDMRSRKHGAYLVFPRQLPLPAQGARGADAGLVTPRLGHAANGANRRWRPPFWSNEQL